MFERDLKPSKTRSFFLFGARGTGKSSLLRELFTSKEAFFFDLLDARVAQDFAAYPERFRNQLDALEGKYPWIVIDEVQKVPMLLDYVHKYIFEKKFHFALTGSSARKLKRGSANLLAGRASLFHLYPLTVGELGGECNLDISLSFGSLPEVYNLKDDLSRHQFLESYTQTYLREEIVAEQLVRNLPPFRRFLDCAAQQNTDIINYSNIARDAQSDAKTISTYYDILEDTLLGFRLPAFDQSIRRQQKKAPKFYFIDNGIARGLLGQTDYRVTPKSYEFGILFENFVCNEIYRLLKYSGKNFKLSFLRVSENLEIDLIIERNNLAPLLCEIKSTDNVRPADHGVSLLDLGSSFKKKEMFLISRDPTEQFYDGIVCLHWSTFLERLAL